MVNIWEVNEAALDAAYLSFTQMRDDPSFSESDAFKFKVRLMVRLQLAHTEGATALTKLIARYPNDLIASEFAKLL